MKDLYLQLGINPDASHSDIEAAFERRPELAESRVILLNESRRAAYNRTVSTMRSIGMLRHRLGLDNNNSWFVDNCPDFAPRLHSKKYAAQAQADEDIPQESPATATTRSTRSTPWLKVLLLGTGIAALLLLLISYL